MFQTAKNNQIKVLFTTYDRVSHVLKTSNNKYVTGMFLKIEPQQYKRKKESLVREDEEMNPQL